MSTSLFDAFGVTSPVADTKSIPLDKVATIGSTHSEPDPGFVFEYRVIRRVLKNIAEQQPVWAWGPSGCGKTELFVQVAKRLARPVHVISMGEETSIRELMGTFDLKAATNGSGAIETSYRYGHLTGAMKDPGAIIVLDEFNMAPAGVSAQFNRLLETGDITIPDTGETVSAAPGVVFMATSNTPGGMDETGIYAGSQSQNGATRSRFAGLKLSYLKPDAEEKLLNLSCPRLNAVVQLPDTSGSPSFLFVQAANTIRSLVEDGEVSLPFTVRNLKLWANSTILFRDIRDAFADAYYDLLMPNEMVAVDAVFHKIFGVHLI